MSAAAAEPPVVRTHRGTSNANVRGNNRDRRKRREWLVTTFRADVDLGPDGEDVPIGQGTPACRCYRCSRLLTVDSVSPDRIDLGCNGGTYKRDNIRPACLPCQSKTGGVIGAARRAMKRGRP